MGGAKRAKFMDQLYKLNWFKLHWRPKTGFAETNDPISWAVSVRHLCVIYKMY